MVIPSGTDRAVSAPAPRLALQDITRAYGSVLALDSASLHVAAGEVHALLGENGAGKSTMMKIAFGLEQPDAGRIQLDGRAITFTSPRSAMQHGLGMVQQHFALVGAMTAAENVALGGDGLRVDMRTIVARMRRISEEAGLPLDPHARVSDLSVGAQQRLEIIKALSRNSTTLILDEPTAVLAPREASELLTWTRRFADGGGTVILIAHKLREVLTVADRVTVLRRGRTVFVAAANEVTESILATAMLGAAQATIVPTSTQAPTRVERASISPVLSLSAVTVRDERNVERLRDVTFTALPNEIVGVAGVEGAGQRELLRILAGRMAPTAGSASLPGRVGFVPEDRHRDAVVLDATLTENVALRDAASRRGVMRWGALRSMTRALMAQRDVRGDDPDATMQMLSGGNQQKLVLGRELADAPLALVVENPTRGLDIRATAAVHAALRDARDAGTAVIVYSSDLDEVLLLADRVVVVAGGRLREVERDRDAVGRAMLTADPA